MRYILIICAALFTAGASLAQSPSAASEYEGDWAGVLHAGGTDLTLILEVRGETVVLVSVDQGNARLTVDTTEMDADRYAGQITQIGATLDLQRSDTDTLSGTFSQGGASYPLTLVRGAAASVEASSGHPMDSEFQVNANGVRLVGALRRPEGDGPFPAVLLLNGSGPQDRDSTIAGQPVFAVLAEALAGRGIASLRLDDRGIGGSSAVAPQSPRDLAQDAVAAIERLRAEADIRGACVGLIGHSEGALIAFLAADAADPAFILPLAGMHQTMAETLYGQSDAIILASGLDQSVADQNRALQTSVFAVMRDETVEDYPAAIADALTALGMPEAQAGQQGAIWGQPYAIAGLDLDASPQMAAYDGPVHAFFGERDLQALAGPQSEALLAARGDRPTEVTVIDGVNHLFQDAETGLPDEYASAPHAMAPRALEAIADAAEALVAQACH